MSTVMQAKEGDLTFEWHGTPGWVGSAYIRVLNAFGEEVDAINAELNKPGPAGDLRAPFTEEVFDSNILDWLSGQE